MNKSPVQPEKPEKGEIQDYEVDNAVETLLRAEEIKKNKPLMDKVAVKLKVKHQAISSLRELRDVAKEKTAKPVSDE